MAYSSSDLQAALDNFVDNLDSKLDQIVNGDTTTDVTVDSGTVPSVAKLFNQMTGTLTAANNEFTATASQTDFVCTGRNIPGTSAVIVTVDGSVQESSTYTIQTTTTSNDTVRLASGLSGGELVQVRLLAAPQSIGTADAANIDYTHPATGGSTRSQLTVNQERISVKDFGAVGDGTTDDTTAVQNALTAAAGRRLFFPNGTYLVTADLSVSEDYTILEGEGAGSVIKLSGCKIHYDAITKATHIFGCDIHNLKIQRTGTAGPAIHMEGQNTMGIARWNMSGVHITSTGSGMQLEAAWIWTMTACVISDCGTHGIDIVVAADGNSSVNAGRLLGCEIQGNTEWGIRSEGHNGLGIIGTSIEGNDVGGIMLTNNCRSTACLGAYFELNGTPASSRDIMAGDTTYSGTKTTGYGLSMVGCTFFDGSGAAKDYSVEITRMQQVYASACYYAGYATGAIYNNPDAGGTTSGVTEQIGTDAPTVLAGSDSRMRQSALDMQITHSSTHAFGTITDGTQSTHDFTVTGTTAGDFVEIATAQNLLGVILTAQAVAANTVRVTATNVTGSDQTIPNATYRIIVKPRTQLI